MFVQLVLLVYYAVVKQNIFHLATLKNKQLCPLETFQKIWQLHMFSPIKFIDILEKIDKNA